MKRIGLEPKCLQLGKFWSLTFFQYAVMTWTNFPHDWLCWRGIHRPPEDRLCSVHGPLARDVKFRVAHELIMLGTFSPSPRISDPDMHHGTWVSHVPWCMPGSLTSSLLRIRWRGKRPHGQPAILRIWQEAHCAKDTHPVRTFHANVDMCFVFGGACISLIYELCHVVPYYS